MTLTQLKNNNTFKDQSLGVPEFPARNGPQRLVAAATKQPRNREKVRLEPGHSPLDWAKLKSSGKDLRVSYGSSLYDSSSVIKRAIFNQGVPQLGRYTLEDLRLHKTQDDAWTAIQGKVYNITPYLKFHPGGVKDLMRCAGRDGTKLFSMYYLFEK